MRRENVKATYIIRVVLLLSALLVNYTGRSCLPPSLGTRLGKVGNFARMVSLWRGCHSYCPFSSPLLCHHDGARIMAMELLPCSLITRLAASLRQFQWIPAMSRNSAAALAGVWSAGGICTHDLCHLSGSALLQLSYGGNFGGYTCLAMRSTIVSIVTKSLFIALTMIDRARTLSCSRLYQP